MVRHDALTAIHERGRRPLAIPDLVDVAPYDVAVDTTEVRRAAGRCATASLPARRDGRSPNAEVGIVIDGTRFATLLVDAFGSLP